MMDSSIGRLTDRLSSCKLHLNKIEQVLEQFSSSSNKENEEVELINDIKEIINQVKESNGEKKKLLEKLQVFIYCFKFNIKVCEKNFDNDSKLL